MGLEWDVLELFLEDYVNEGGLPQMEVVNGMLRLQLHFERSGELMHYQEHLGGKVSGNVLQLDLSPDLGIPVLITWLNQKNLEED